MRACVLAAVCCGQADAIPAAPASTAPAKTDGGVKGNAEAGRIKAESERCLECHGQPGVEQGHSAGEDGKFARLGGQQHAYIVKQVQDFRAGRRKNDFMVMMAASVSDDDVADIAAYFAAQPAMPAAIRAETRGESRSAGQHGPAAALFRQGDAARKVAACATCHGAAGEGIAGMAPVIGGQGRRYLSQQLHNWRSGERSNGAGMREAAASLTDAEIDALALYVSEM
nr:c-type cytochrome [Pseudoduganella ginsengisoli]